MLHSWTPMTDAPRRLRLLLGFAKPESRHGGHHNQTEPAVQFKRNGGVFCVGIQVVLDQLHYQVICPKTLEELPELRDRVKFLDVVGCGQFYIYLLALLSAARWYTRVFRPRYARELGGRFDSHNLLLGIPGA